MQELGLMERFADPALFETLTIGEKTAAGLVTTLMGMGTTFAVLILLWGIIAFISGIIRRAEKKASAPALSAEAIKAAPAEKILTAKPQQAAVTADPSGNELAAVLMAAIAASQGQETVSKLVIRKIQRLSGNRTPWDTAGTADCIESRKF